MLNNLYATPSHGVAFCVSSPPKTLSSSHNSHLPYILNLSEQHISVPSSASVIWTLQDKGARYSTSLTLYASGKHTYILDIDCEGRGRFQLHKNHIAVDWQQEGTDSSHYFQTIVMALWLELNQIPCIHANALEYKGKTIALIGPSGMGKSTLSAYLQQQGFTWLTDDMLAIHKNGTVYPSWPKARMWPDSISNVAQLNLNNLSRVHERFTKRELNLPPIDTTQARQLHGIYLLNRQGADLKNAQSCINLRNHHHTALPKTSVSTCVSHVNASIAIMALLQNSMMGSAYSALDLESARLTSLSELMQNIPIKQLNYANDYDNLGAVKELLLNDL